MSYKEDFIHLMLKSDVLKFGDFKTKSGRMSPYFINTGFFNNSEEIAKLGDFYAKAYMDNIKLDKPLLFGPAYKGIPLVVSCAVSLYKNYGLEIGYSFNRKEAKDHGEKGIFVGETPNADSDVVIIEDVITAGTAVRESIDILKHYDAKVKALIVSVNRMERGSGDKSAIHELEDDYGVKVYSILDIKFIADYLRNKEIDGKVYIDEEMYAKIMKHLDTYKER
ncbi:orotate phosphoribosyltransferase [Fenollaria massiliensis]|uniref:Orotate phosphoribosyltransferase n=1 Tax=Fenollaria massiliensis TaxID=938288 RepID=A0A9E7DKF2_9FIRM|nr:orotate phosphoribosyltransferase [Fenollaria massiliensis]UQK59476.1 orotate phosphoribosyltransferase [Fenollaria massiliensis]